MKRWSLLLLVLVACTALFAQQKPAAAPPPTAAPRLMVGIMPTYDSSGESFGEDFSRYITLMIFQELYPSDKLEPMMLNPGGIYSPLEEEWIVDFGRKSNVDAVLVTNVLESDKPKNSNNWALKMETFVVDLKTGKKGNATTLTVPISKKDLQAGLDAGRRSYTAPISSLERGLGWAPFTTAGMMTSMALDSSGRVALMMYASGPSRVFESQPIGKGARRLAVAARTQAVADTASLTPGGPSTPPPSGAATCGPIKFRVRYASKNSNSKVFTILMNDREESQGVHDGVVALNPPAGPLVLVVEVKDSPFKLPVQKVYQANTYLDCGQPERTLMMEIGGAGEALLKWQQ